jgi:hypothetical protein
MTAFVTKTAPPAVLTNGTVLHGLEEVADQVFQLAFVEAKNNLVLEDKFDKTVFFLELMKAHTATTVLKGLGDSKEAQARLTAERVESSALTIFPAPSCSIESSHRPPRHRRGVCSTAWRRGSHARPIWYSRLVAEK